MSSRVSTTSAYHTFARSVDRRLLLPLVAANGRVGLVLFSVAFASLYSSLVAGELVEIPWRGPNLVVNPSFEAVDGEPSKLKHWHAQFPANKGVEVRTDTAVRLAGKNSLRMSLPQSGSHVYLMSGFVPVKGGQGYLVSVGFRQAGFNRKGRRGFEGVNSHPSLMWFDSKKRGIGASGAMSRFPYGPSGWNLRDGFALAPANASYVRFSARMWNNSERKVRETIPSTLWLDAVQLREYRRPETPAWAKGETEMVVDGDVDRSPVRSFFLAGAFGGTGGKWSKIAVDKDAERGSALVAPAGVGRGMMAHSAYFPAMPPGLYRLRVRAKVTDNTAAKPVGLLDMTSQLAGLRTEHRFMPKQFEAPNRYQDFERDFILRDDGWWCIRFHTLGNQSWAVDSVKVFPLHEMTDKELFSVYPGSAGDVDASLKPWRHGPRKALFVAGFGYDFYRPARALRLADGKVTVTPAWVYHDFRTARVKKFPETAEELFDFSIVYLCNVPVKCLTLRQKNFLHEYVQRGGAMVVMAGHQAYERGGGRGSLLEETMPVRMLRTVDDGLLYFKDGLPVTIAPNIHWLREISTRQKPMVYFLHKVAVKPGAQVLARAGDEPFLVVGTYGKGRVACVLGPPNGDPAEGQTGFWEWDDWVYLLRDASWWTMQHREIGAP